MVYLLARYIENRIHLLENKQHVVMRVDKAFLLTQVTKISYDPSNIDAIRLDGSEFDFSAIKSLGRFYFDLKQKTKSNPAYNSNFINEKILCLLNESNSFD